MAAKPWISDEDVIRIFENLPENVGCDESQLAFAERSLQLVFPPTFRRLMRAACRRLLGAGICLPLAKIVTETSTINDQLEAEGFQFRVPPRHAVIQLDPYGGGFCFFEGSGDDQVPVFTFDVDGPLDGSSRAIRKTIPEFFASSIRTYLDLWGEGTFNSR